MAQGSNGTHTQKTSMQGNVPQLARNHYFTGKLLVERDFTDEQLYHMGKEMRHARHLHGSGSVCGLKVKQHSNQACCDQYVVIEPGTAIDCCGRELLVMREEYFDFKTKIAEKKVDLGTGEHTLQICIRYNECPTEQMPVLFDDCSCDGTTSQPNRIMEGYDFDVLIDPVIKHRILDDVHLEWQHTLNVVHANRIAVDEANHRLYVLTPDTPSTLHVYRTDNYSVIAHHRFHVPAMDIALSHNGTRVYVSLRQRHSVLVLDTAALGTPQALINELPAPGVPTGDVRLAVSPRDGHLYMLAAARRLVIPWRAGINHKSDDVDDFRLHDIRVGNAPLSIVASPDGRWIFVANSGDKTVSAIDAVSHGQPPILLHLGNVAPSELAVADTTDGLKLYVTDNTNNTVSILGLQLRADPPFTALGSPLSFAPDKPVGVAVSPTGRWLYVLLADANGKGRIQVVDAHRVEVGAAYPLGKSLPVGDVPSELALVSARQRLYVAFQGKSADTDPGGVATIHVREETCEDLFKRALNDWPDCNNDDECVVLATIKGYKANGQITQEAIDNLSDRRLLPSTDLVTDVVRCILENGGGKGQRGEEGPQGKPGRDGKDGEDGEDGEDGRGIEAVQATFVDCDEEGSASLQDIDETLTLVLEIPRGCDGQDAPLPVPVEYTRICAISWEHRGRMDIDDLEDGLLIAFSRRVRAGDINSHTFQVLIHTEERGLIVWRELPHKHLGGIQLELAELSDGTCEIVEREEEPHHDADDLVNGALFELRDIPTVRRFTLRVIFKGDLVQDEYQLGVDANHLPPWLPNRPTGDGIEGGTFESWFHVEAR